MKKIANIENEPKDLHRHLHDYEGVKPGIPKWFKSLRIFPTVYAAKDSLPSKPNPMTAKDLPLYKNPHADYNEYINEKKYSCAKRDKPKLLQSSIVPAVTFTRRAIQSNYAKGRDEILSLYKGIISRINTKLNETKKYLRSEENASISQTLVTFGGLAGYVFVRKNGLPTKILNSTIGAGAMGALCFPKETDEIARKMGKVAVLAINSLFMVLYGVPYFVEYKCLKTEAEPPKTDMDIKCD